MAKYRQPPPRRQQEPAAQYGVRWGWFIIPMLLLGLYACIKSILPVLSWDQVMDWLDVQNRQRYTMLALLCLSLTLIAAIWRILRR